MEQTIPDQRRGRTRQADLGAKACFDCHTLSARARASRPELGKVWLKYGGGKDPAGAEESLKAWFAAQPTGVEGRHQMPQFHLSDADVHDMVDVPALDEPRRHAELAAARAQVGALSLTFYSGCQS